MVQKAASLAGPQTAALVAVVRLLTMPAAPPAEWLSRVERLIPNPAQSQVRDTTLAYALLLAGEFEAATPVLERIYRNGFTSSEDGLPFLLAWAYLEMGRVSDAAPLLRWTPIPPIGGPSPFFVLHFPRYSYLRGVAAQKQGHTEEARQQYKLFIQLSGSDPLVWGEEQKAARAF
jgi:hypothetical protein